jgi:Ca2+-binding RTX toxin-like protein
MITNSLLSQAYSQATVKLQGFAQQPDFLAQLQVAFGDDFDTNIALGIAKQLQSGDFSLIPDIQVLTNGELGNANGAFAADLDQIFVSSDFLARYQGDVNIVSELLLEEIGHKIDRVLNGNLDSPGDEGAIFRLLATGQDLSAENLAGLRTQDDHAVIVVDGRSVEVEKQDFYGDAGGIITNNTFDGTSSNDNFYPGRGADIIDGGLGTDYLQINNSADPFTAPTTITYTTTANGTITGGSSNGTTFQNIEQVNFTTGAGNDNINVSAATGSSGNVTIRGGAGDDTIIASLTGENNSYYGDDGNDNITAGNSASGDYLFGGAGNDTLNGGAGNDYYFPGAGADVINGGTGNHILFINNSTDIAANNINYTSPTNGTITGGSNNGSVLNNIKQLNIVTGSGNDTINISAATGSNNNINAGVGNDIIVGSLTGSGGYLGGDGDDTITAGNSTSGDVLLGDNGNDILNGGTGNDILNGGTGNDTYNINASVTNRTTTITEIATGGIDTISFQSSNAAITVDLTQTGIQTVATTATNTAKVFFSGIGGINYIENVIGGSGADTIIGDTLNNRLDGGAGADAMSGGAGDDTYVVDIAGDTITELLGGGIDTVESSINYALGSYLENLTLTGTGNLNGTGNSLDNTIIGNSGNNIFNAGFGADSMSGGAGNDTYIVENAGDVVTENLDQGTDTVESFITYTLGNNVENLIFTGSDNINGTGNGLNNTINGNSGNNRIDGGLGADTMSGGNGNDTFIVDNIGDVVTEGNSGAGTDTVESSVNYTLGLYLENLTLTGTGNIDGTGNELDNTIIGNSGNNRLNGGLGADTMSGGAGNDTYVINTAGDTITEAIGEGIDTVESSLVINGNSGYILTNNVENLTLTGTANINGTGNSLDNILTGNSGNNLLYGGRGNDTLIGGNGDDTYYISDIAADLTNDTIIEGVNGGTDYAVSIFTVNQLADNVEYLILNGSADINGTGNSLNNNISGNSGNNIINGGAGADTMIGGNGNDTYIVDNIGDVITEASGIGTGTDSVQSSVTYTLATNVENLTLTGTANIDGFGNGQDNTITGNSGNNVLRDFFGGNDTLVGGDGNDDFYAAVGNDTLIGGNGDDTYYLSFQAADLTNDTIVEGLNGGTDTALSIFTVTQLADNVENLGLIGTSNIDGTGNSLNNTIGGNGGNNIIDGGTGDDILRGNDGNDTLIGGDGNDDLYGGIGTDTLTGGNGDDTYYLSFNASDLTNDTIFEGLNGGTDTALSIFTVTQLADNVEKLGLIGTSNIDGTGNSLNNTISGNGGNNILNGAGGADQLFGGAGNDTYIVSQTLGGGTIIDDASGTNDTLTLTGGATLTNSNISRNGTTLLIDLNQNSIFDPASDLSIKNFFANTFGNIAGNGFIENVGSLSGSTVLNLYTSISTRNDFGGDGKSDIVWRNDNGAIALWQMNGSTVTANNIVASLSSDWKTSGTGDFGGDGKSDIVWRNDNGAIAMWQMNGATVTANNIVASLSSDWKASGTGDFGGDGKSDMLWRNDNGAIAMWQMNGATVTGNNIVASLSSDWNASGTGDFGGDGKSDLLWRNDNGAVAMWQMNGAIVTGNNIVASLSSDWKASGTGDFNGDGKSDMLWRNDNGAVALWQMDGSTVVSSKIVASLSSDWKIAGTGDLNGDGKSDLLWRNDNGAIALWQMNGSDVTNNNLVAVLDPTWAVATPII